MSTHASTRSPGSRRAAYRTWLGSPCGHATHTGITARKSPRRLRASCRADAAQPGSGRDSLGFARGHHMVRGRSLRMWRTVGAADRSHEHNRGVYAAAVDSCFHAPTRVLHGPSVPHGRVVGICDFFADGSRHHFAGPKTMAGRAQLTGTKRLCQEPCWA